MLCLPILLLILSGIGITTAILWPDTRLIMHDWLCTLPAFMTTNWLTFGLGQIIVAASGMLPASMIAMMAGALLGFGWGLALSVFSTMLGGWIAFALSRSVLRESIARHVRRHPAIDRLDDTLSQEGWRMVALLRVSPVMPFALTSYAIGLTRISQRDFLLGTLASLPALAGYVTLGALGQQSLLTTNSRTEWVLAIGGIIIFYALYRAKKTFNRLAEA